MNFDETPRWLKVGDAISQFLNVLLLPRHKSTSANESISGRCYREGWKTAEKIVNILFLWLEEDHCRVAHYQDVERSKKFVEQDAERRSAQRGQAV